MSEYDAGNEELVERKKGIDKGEQDQDDDDLRAILRTKWGRRFVWRMLNECGINHPNPTDNETLRRLGRRDVGLAVQSWVFTIEPNAYTLMLNEALAREQTMKERLDG